jgi:ribonuclease P protein component
VKGEGFPKEERVRRSAEFTRILQEGKRHPGRFLYAFWIPDGAPPAVNRVGVAVGKRLGKAAVRSRLKRRIREAYRRKKRELPCRGLAIIFRASRHAVGRSSRDIEADVEMLLRLVAESSASPSSPFERSSSSTVG